jgi:hypothetical protein
MQILLLLSSFIASRQESESRRSRNMSIAILRISIRRRSIRNSTTNDISKAKILTVIKTSADADFKSMFRLSRPVFLASSQDLSPWLKDCRSRNSRKNVPAEKKIEKALYYMAHGGDGVNLEVLLFLTCRKISSVFPCQILCAPAVRPTVNAYS